MLVEEGRVVDKVIMREVGRFLGSVEGLWGVTAVLEFLVIVD